MKQQGYNIQFRIMCYIVYKAIDVNRKSDERRKENVFLQRILYSETGLKFLKLIIFYKNCCMNYSAD